MHITADSGATDLVCMMYVLRDYVYGTIVYVLLEYIVYCVVNTVIKYTLHLQ